MNFLVDIAHHLPLATGLYIGIASIVVGVIGTGVSAYGQHQAAEAAEDAAHQASTEKKLAAQKEGEVAAENARRAEQEKTRAIAAQLAANANNGLSTEGTPLAVLGDTAVTLEMEILDIGHQSAMRQRALIAGAKADQIEGKAAASSLRIGAASTAISGAGSALSSGYTVSQNSGKSGSQGSGSGSTSFLSK